MNADLVNGRLSQVCQACGVVEAAGSYCTACLARTGEACWGAREQSPAQRDARARQRASVNALPANPATVEAAS